MATVMVRVVVAGSGVAEATVEKKGVAVRVAETAEAAVGTRAAVATRVAAAVVAALVEAVAAETARA